LDQSAVLLSTEGINLFVAGSRESINLLLVELRNVPGLSSLEPKISESEHQPFNRMLVRIKKEIIAFGVEGIDPGKRTSPKLPATTLKQWLDEGRTVTLLDTRNDYEVKLGTFKNAHTIGIDHFREFPDAVRKLPESMKDQPIVMFCTGGVRCEKAGPFMEMEGFRNIFQLEGGILKYFEECGSAHYDGECFVFDQRVGVDRVVGGDVGGPGALERGDRFLRRQLQVHTEHGLECPHLPVARVDAVEHGGDVAGVLVPALLGIRELRLVPGLGGLDYMHS
jgi:predicted sulfurtransferase